jgi:ribosomal protein S27E
MKLNKMVSHNKEKQELENIKKIYGKKPKIKCPKCNKKTLFFKNDKGEIFCIRCDKIVRIENV